MGGVLLSGNDSSEKELSDSQTLYEGGNSSMTSRGLGEREGLKLALGAKCFSLKLWAFVAIGSLGRRQPNLAAMLAAAPVMSLERRMLAAPVMSLERRMLAAPVLSLERRMLAAPVTSLERWLL